MFGPFRRLELSRIAGHGVAILARLQDAFVHGVGRSANDVVFHGKGRRCCRAAVGAGVSALLLGKGDTTRFGSFHVFGPNIPRVR